MKQSPRAWYEIKCFLTLKRIQAIGKVDTKLFTKHIENDLSVCQVYVDDIILDQLIKNFVKIWRDGSSCVWNANDWQAKLFHWASIKQIDYGNLWVKESIPRICWKNRMDEAKPIHTPVGTNGHLDLDKGGDMVDQKLYESMIRSHSLWLHQDWMWCLAYAYV